MTAQMLALRRPDLISSLCLAATTCLPPYHGRAVWDERTASIRETGRFDHMLAPMMDRWLSMKFRRESLERYDQIKGMVLRTPTERLYRLQPRHRRLRRGRPPAHERQSA